MCGYVFDNMAFIIYTVSSYGSHFSQFLSIYSSLFSLFMLNSQAAGVDKAF